MARLESAFPFVGSLGDVTVYKNYLTGKWIVRMKGGATKEKIKTSPSCQGIRDQNVEFKACGMANRNMFLAMKGVKHLKDFVVAGAFTKIIKAVQCIDPVHQKGKRDIIFSTNTQFLEGFQLNRTHPFDTVLSHPITGTIYRSEGRATVQIPEVLPGINFVNPWPYASFRFIVSIGAIYDIIYKEAEKRYTTQHPTGNAGVSTVRTNWMPATMKNPGQQVDISLQELIANSLDDSTTIILSVGIEFGTQSFTEIKPVKRAGCAKFLAIG